MSPRPAGRTALCGRAEAVTRLEQAGKFHEVADLVAAEGDVVAASASMAASLAVLAGIAAADAACCVALGRRVRGQDHRQAVELLGQVEPGGRDAGKQLARLLDLKDTAQYGVIHVSRTELRAAMRAATALLRFATDTVRR